MDWDRNMYYHTGQSGSESNGKKEVTPRTSHPQIQNWNLLSGCISASY